MAKERNTSGILNYVRNRRKLLLSNTDVILTGLEREGLPTDFSEVAKLAEVSVAWLYRQPQIKKRICKLRNKNSKNPASINQDVLLAKIEELERQNGELISENIKLKTILNEIQSD